jgi:adenylate kinase
MGAQGVGKGTQAVRVAPLLGLVHLSTGDLFRAAIASGSELGQRIKAIYDRGELITDDITIDLVRQRLNEIAANSEVKGALFDGFPRNNAQAEALDHLLGERGERIDAVVEIKVPMDVLVTRLAGRRVCTRCGTAYHVAFNPPSRPDVCDRCGGKLVQRDDDKPGPIKQRLDLYFSQTEPLLDYYRRRDVRAEVDGDQPIELVTDALLDAIARLAGTSEAMGQHADHD